MEEKHGKEKANAKLVREASRYYLHITGYTKKKGTDREKRRTGFQDTIIDSERKR
jgi:hypothetical protein